MGRLTIHYTVSVIITWVIMKIGLIHGEVYIPSRGRSGAIHQFYDQRVQTLRPYMLVDMDHSNSYITNNPRGGSTLKRTVTKTYSEYVEKLEINGEAKLDLLLNIFEGGFQGQGSYTKIERQSSSSIFAFVEIIQYTREEKTDLCDPKWIKHVQFPLVYSNHVQATHIIKGKLYGLYLEIILEIHESEGDSNSNLEVDVQAELDSFLARIDLSSSTSKTSASKKYLSKSKILTYCNLINCPTPPQNLDQLEQFIKNSISTLTLNDDTQGNEIALIADDLRSLTECWNVTIDNLYNKTKMHELSGQNINSIESIIREIEEGVASVNSFHTKMRAFKECIPETVMSDIQQSSVEAMIFANTFKSKLKKFVIYVRFGKRDQAKLAKKIKLFRSSLKNPTVTLERLTTDYHDWLKKIRFYSSIDKANLHCLPAKLNLLTLFESSRHQVHVFYLMGNTTIQDNDNFIAKLPTFANICADKCKNCSCYIADCFFEFSFCKTFDSNQILKYSQGILTLVNNTLDMLSSQDYEMIQQAILFMYIQDAKTIKTLSVLNDKIEAYYNEIKNVVTTKMKVSHDFKSFNDVHQLLNHDSVGRSKNNRTDKNPVEMLLQQYIDLGE